MPLALCHFSPDSLPSLPHLPRLFNFLLYFLSLPSCLSFPSFPLPLPSAMTRVCRKSVVVPASPLSFALAGTTASVYTRAFVFVGLCARVFFPLIY